MSELSLDFNELERVAQDSGGVFALYPPSDLPPPPKNLFLKEPGSGAYRTRDDATRTDGRHADAREEPGEPGPVSERPLSRSRPPHVPSARPQTEARYGRARPAAIFASTQRPAPPPSLFSDELASDKSLDEVILSYLAEDLKPPSRR